MKIIPDPAKICEILPDPERCFKACTYLSDNVPHRRKINTEKKAKVVASVWGTEFIQFFPRDRISTRTI